MTLLPVGAWVRRMGIRVKGSWKTRRLRKKRLKHWRQLRLEFMRIDGWIVVDGKIRRIWCPWPRGRIKWTLTL